MQPVVLSFQSSKDKVSYYLFEITKTLYVKTDKNNNEIIKISEKTEKALRILVMKNCAILWFLLIVHTSNTSIKFIMINTTDQRY